MLHPRFGLVTLVIGILDSVRAAPYAGPCRGLEKKASAKSADQAAIDRTREQVKMLDDLYKTAVVKITKVYVGQQGEVPVWPSRRWRSSRR